jgi:hypothetical protein
MQDFFCFSKNLTKAAAAARRNRNERVRFEGHIPIWVFTHIIISIHAAHILFRLHSLPLSHGPHQRYCSDPAASTAPSPCSLSRKQQFFFRK